MDFIKKNGAGLLLCLCIAIPAWLLGQAVPVVGGPVFSILIGMVLTLFWKDKTKVQPGIGFTSKKVLQYAVILLGFGLNLSEIAKVGAQSLPIIVSTIGTSLIVSFVLCKAMKVPSNISTLVGVGSSICGGSAIAATAPVIGADDEEIAQAISVIFLFNVIAALTFPTLGGMLGMTDHGFGLFAGTAVNDTSSVTAAASAWDGIHGSNTLEIATIVKLTRTLAIIPITLVLALWRTHKAKTEQSQGGKAFSLKRAFPMFILYFVLASIITTVCTTVGVPAGVFTPLKTLSKFFIVMAMAAIGMNTNIVKLVKTGGKPIFMGLLLLGRYCVRQHCNAAFAWFSLSGMKAQRTNVLVLRLSKTNVFRAASRSKPRFRSNSEKKKRLAGTFFFPCINSEIHARIYEFAPQILFYACCRTKQKRVEMQLFRQDEAPKDQCPLCFSRFCCCLSA